MEAYYQQAGRAGRDGLSSTCILYYTREDCDRVVYLISKSEAEQAEKARAKGLESAKNSGKAFQNFVKYCENTTKCRHLYIMDYFGEETRNLDAAAIEAVCSKKTQCDICRDPVKVAREWTSKVSASNEAFGGYTRRGRFGVDELCFLVYAVHHSLAVSTRLADGTRVIYKNPRSSGVHSHEQEISLVDDVVSEDDGSYGRNRKRAHAQVEDEESIDDSDKDDGGQQLLGSAFVGFKTASGKQILEKEDRRMLLFGKPTATTVNTANRKFVCLVLLLKGLIAELSPVCQKSTRFPNMYEPPRQGLIRDLPLAERERLYEKIAAASVAKLGTADKW
ncbi:hypothetical protein HDU84_002551, partial [Entophlyctis sp. JEL0112]